MKPDKDTRAWIRTVADERAAAAGMRFSPKLATRVVDWIETNCYLYEGDKAGQPLKLLPAWREFFMRLYGWVWRSPDHNNEWIRRFNKASFWGAKKNGKSPCCAAHNLYLLCGDGEQGQKVYQAAANGDQAKIAQRHAVNMVLQSPMLREQCKINNTTLQITHMPTSSMLIILAGDDSRGARSKEGLNGSVSYDEMHVVNREMEERTSRAGISRREPINASFSTAGDDPSSVGFERCQYGRQVNEGKRDDLHFLHVEYASDEKVHESDIDARLEELGKKANPAWGYIVKPSEFRADWERSKGNPREVARFKQYRLNLWVGSTSPWLDQFGWEKGKRSYALDDLRGRDCFAGLDLSRTRDMTACVWLFPWPEDGPECIRVWPMFWLPEKMAKARDHLFPFQSWARAGALTLTPGDVVDYKVVEDEIVGTAQRYDLRCYGLYFDQHYAEEITQRITERMGMASNERVAVSQTLMSLTSLAKEWERRTSMGAIQHAGNPVMDWQVGHVEVWADKNQNIRPVKPESGTAKSIDGIMAALDAMAGVMSNMAGPSIYETRGFEELGAGSTKPTAAVANQEKAAAVSWLGDDDDDDNW